MNRLDLIILCSSLLLITTTSLLLAIFINKFFWIIVFAGVGCIFYLNKLVEQQKKDIDKD